MKIERIDHWVLEEFGNRKYKKGRLDFFVDVEKNAFYPVPRDMEHKDFFKEIYTGKENFVPSQLRLKNSAAPGRYDLLEVIVGASSYEASTGKRHHPKDLVKAFNLTWDMINRSPIINPVTIIRNEILHDFEERPKHNSGL